MNTKLKEKIYKAAKKHSECAAGKRDKWNCEADFTVGAAIMYAELAPLVEWVSVEERLPKEDELVVAKFSKKYHKIPETVRFLNGKFYHSIGDDVSPFFPRIGIDITHWRRIEL